MGEFETRTIPVQSITGTQPINSNRSSELTDLKEEIFKGMEEKEKEGRESQNESKDDDIFKTEEVTIEEMAIDGICGVY